MYCSALNSKSVISDSMICFSSYSSRFRHELFLDQSQATAVLNVTNVLFIQTATFLLQNENSKLDIYSLLTQIVYSTDWTFLNGTTFSHEMTQLLTTHNAL